MDLRNLSPPGPLLAILERLEADDVGPHVFLLAREPYPLYALLAVDGWYHSVQQDARGYVLTVYRRSAAAGLRGEPGPTQSAP